MSVCIEYLCLLFISSPFLSTSCAGFLLFYLMAAIPSFATLVRRDSTRVPFYALMSELEDLPSTLHERELRVTDTFTDGVWATWSLLHRILAERSAAAFVKLARRPTCY